MKKLFTLIAVALIAMSASAKQEILLSDYSPWNTTVVVDGNTVTMDGSYQGGAIYIGADMSQYDYVWIKFSNATGKPNFGITYDEWTKTESWGEVYASATVALDGSGVAFLKLDKETVMVYGNAKENGVGIGDVYAQHVQQLTIQSAGQSGAVTVEGIYFGSAEELIADGGDLPVRPAAGESLTIWEGSHVYGSGWSDTDVFDAKYFDVAEVGDIIYCTFIDGNEPNPVFKEVATWADFKDVQATIEIGDGYFQGTIATEAALDYLKKNGFRLQGINFTLTKVELKVPVSDGIQAINAEKNVNAPIYNLSGQRVDAQYKGVVIQNGKKFMQK